MSTEFSQPFRIENVSNGGVVHFGDTPNISPTNVSKAYAGHSSFGLGMYHFHLHINGGTGSMVSDPDTSDSTIACNCQNQSTSGTTPSRSSTGTMRF